MSLVAKAVAQRHIELATLLQGLTSSDLAAPSLLPGWSRQTIVCHLRFGAESSLAMTQAALAGDEASFYPHGRAQQRPRTLVPRPDESDTQIVDSFIRASTKLDSLWQTLGIEDWAVEVREPADNPDLGTIGLDVFALLRLTEVEVHGRDLDVGATPWSDVFVDAALPMRLRWLKTRRSNHTPANDSLIGTWVLQPTNGTGFAISASPSGVTIAEGHQLTGDVTIAGSGRDLLGFLLGRVALSQLSVAGDRQLAESFSLAFPPP